MVHKFSRTARLIGEAGVLKLAESSVIVFGIGGVGSFAVEALARAGVGRLTLVDNDVIAETNINRQLHATTKTVGRLKVEVMKERIVEINPEAEVEALRLLYLPASAERFFHRRYDYIVDAIDMVTGKIDLAVQAAKYSIPLISCMGAGNKLNPALFEVADIYDTSVCPLAKVMRRELKNRGIEKLKVVYSKEKPLTVIEDMEEKGRRSQLPGSISFVPSAAGLILAGEVVKDILKIEG